MSEEFEPTSVMHRDIGPHQHEMTIYNMYEVYAVCNRCGMHDWADIGLEGFHEKYPTATEVDMDYFDDAMAQQDDCEHAHVSAQAGQMRCADCGNEVYHNLDTGGYSI